MKIFILVREENAYDQYGEYFIAAFKDMPTKDQFEKVSEVGKITDKQFYKELVKDNKLRIYNTTYSIQKHDLI